jgi:hypothetical protein
MIIHFYQKHFSTQFVVYLLFAVLLWLDVIIFPVKPPVIADPTPVYAGLAAVTNHIPRPVQTILAFLLILIQAFIFNEVMIRHKIIARNTFLPALIYIVLMSYSPLVQILHPVVIANLFLIFSFNLILGLYLKPEPYKEIFNATFLIALASFFYLPALAFIILFWVALLVYRISAAREWIISLSGLIAPYLFVLFYYYWTDSLGVFFNDFPGFFTHISSLQIYQGKPLIKEIYLALGGLATVLLFISLIKIASETSEKVITLRKRMNVMIYSLFIAGLSFIWADHNVIIHMTMMAIPAAMIISYFYSGIKRLAIAEISFTFLILLMIFLKLIYRVEA